MARLKVFSWSNGFHRFTVATTSKPKALEAWGLTQDIFKTGLAAEDPHSPDADVALARPGEVVQRGEAVDVGEVAPAPRKAGKAKAPSKPKGPSPADLKRVAKLEAELEGLDARYDAGLADLDRKRAELEGKAADLREAHRKARAELRKRLDAARARL